MTQQPKDFISFFGMDIRDRKNYLQGVEIDASLKDRFAKSTAYCRFFSLFNHLGDRAYQRIAQLPIGQDPLFILGYFRSGTTFLHTLLSKDPQFAFTTNYHAGFPHLVLWGQSFFKRLRSIGRPKKRADKIDRIGFAARGGAGNRGPYSLHFRFARVFSPAVESLLGSLHQL